MQIMRANFRMQRLFVEGPLAAGAKLAADRDQFNYLANVLCMQEDDRLLVFNGRDGEWSVRLVFNGRKKLSLCVEEQTRPQPPASDLHYLFAPLKQARLDYTVQKAVEMGAGTIQPALTHHTHDEDQCTPAGTQRRRGGGTMRDPLHSRMPRAGAARPAAGGVGPATAPGLIATKRPRPTIPCPRWKR